jgi:hemerythrin-like domain-containing protein
MGDVAGYMTHEHRECDELFAKAEAAVDAGNWAVADEQFTAYDSLTRLHLRREEEVLFPEFEFRTGMTSGPTAMMRIEHNQIRALLVSMTAALAERDTETFLGEAETLMILTQQHNMKEEQILYPMTDTTLASDASEVIGRMKEVD